MWSTLRSRVKQQLNIYLTQKQQTYAKYTLTSTAIFLSWIPVVYEISDHVVYIGKIQGSSMKPTFNPTTAHDYVLLWKFNVRAIKNLHHNDVIFLRSPLDPEQIYTKRIKGMPNEVIKPRYPDLRNKVLIPYNHLWVEGDNIHSLDSNTYGPISANLVLGKAVFIIWPLNRIGWVPHEGGRECREAYLKYDNVP